MGHTSHRWLLSAALIALGTAFDGAAVTLYWRACDGELLNGSVFSTMQSGTGFSDSCLVAMDQAAMFPLPELGDGMTLVASLGAVAALLLASAWLVLLPALDVPGKAARIAALPGTLGIALVVEGVVGSLVPWPDYPDFLFVALAGLLSLSAPFALTALGDAKVTWPVLCGAAVVAFAATAPGFGQQILDFFVMLSLSDADWDKPPGSGYPTVALLAVSAFAIVAIWGLDAVGRRARLLEQSLDELPLGRNGSRRQPG